MKVPFRYDPATAAVIVVDIQNDFCSASGSLAEAGFDTAAVPLMIQRLHRLLAAARKSNTLVIFVATTHDSMTDSPQWVGRLGDGPGTERTSVTCRPGTWGSEFYEVQPQPGEPVIVKNRFSSFVGTNLDLVLRSRGIQSLLFTGVTTETCVESSLRDGLFHEYYVTLIEDCAASYRAEAHAASVRVVSENFGTVTTSAELIDMWTMCSAEKNIPRSFSGTQTPQ
ncbi:MAG: rutB [Homoserinimonas sp.]|jgi:ureidoacrylate peracid hydrolase|nr:rutB [Homoserinimonas sp.]